MVIELFSLGVTVRRCRRISIESRRFCSNGVTLTQNFRGRGRPYQRSIVAIASTWRSGECSRRSTACIIHLQAWIYYQPGSFAYGLRSSVSHPLHCSTCQSLPPSYLGNGRWQSSDPYL